MAEQQREAFEATYRDVHGQIDARIDRDTDSYLDLDVESDWAVWKAAWDSALSHAEGAAPVAEITIDSHGDAHFRAGPNYLDLDQGTYQLYTHPAPQVAVPEGWTIRRGENGEINFEAPSGARGWLYRPEPLKDEPLSSSTIGRAFFDLCSDLLAAPTAPAGEPVSYEHRVNGWMQECFGPEISGDIEERNHRFLEEALELVQSTGCTADAAHRLVDYVFGRPVGEPFQEVGGVRVTLAALCLANGINGEAAAEAELARITQPETITRIREKQRRKPAFGPLPGAYPEREPAPQQPVSDPDGVPNNSRALVDQIIEDLQKGFVVCNSCGDQEDTATLDVMDDLRRLRFLIAAASNRSAPDEREIAATGGSVSPRHPEVVKWRDDAIRACAEIADRYGDTPAAADMRKLLERSDKQGGKS